MANSIQIGKLEETISKELTLYCDEVTKKVKQASDDVMNDLVENTKKDANKRTGKYRRAIASKRTRETSRVRVNTWYVKEPHSSLTHLLTDGHDIKVGKKGQTKSIGKRTRTFDFLKKHEKKAVEEYTKRVEEIIKYGS